MNREKNNRQDWMDGRSVFVFPEAKSSNVAKRNIVSGAAEHDKLTRTQVRVTLARRAMSIEEVNREITEYLAEEQRRSSKE